MLITSWIAYFLVVIIFQYNDMFNSFASMSVTFFSSRFWLNLFLILGACALIDFSSFCFSFQFSDSLSSELQKLVKERGSINGKHGLSPLVLNNINAFEQITMTKPKIKSMPTCPDKDFLKTLGKEDLGNIPFNNI